MNNADIVVFKDGQEFEDLPIGTHEPCLLDIIEKNDPSEENLKKYPDLKTSWCFRFVLLDADSEHHMHSSVRFCNVSDSKLSHLFSLVIDLNGGEQPTQFDPSEFRKKWYRIRVRKKAKSEKVHVDGADPIDAPKDALKLEAAWMEKTKKDDDEAPF